MNKLYIALKNRLRDPVRYKSDGSLADSIFTDEQLNMFLDSSITAFNMIPPFTNFSIKHDNFCDMFSPLLVNYAAYLALSSEALVEKGRENDGLSSLLFDESKFEFEIWHKLVSDIKKTREFGFLSAQQQVSLINGLLYSK